MGKHMRNREGNVSNWGVAELWRLIYGITHTDKVNFQFAPGWPSMKLAAPARD